ncbi:MAG TPA: hypothetical protein PLK78_15310, partial [Verrucomicrobiota bacterium]|nr:hypothetical protein [Verrucomicrobiota bacterium]
QDAKTQEHKKEILRGNWRNLEGLTGNVAEADHLRIPWTQRCSRAAAEDSRAPRYCPISNCK